MESFVKIQRQSSGQSASIRVISMTLCGIVKDLFGSQHRVDRPNTMDPNSFNTITIEEMKIASRTTMSGVPLKIIVKMCGLAFLEVGCADLIK